MTTIVGRLETKTRSIHQLIQVIREGEVKIPKFQRRFVWSANQALRLLDSIAHYYPIGSILLWRTHTKITAERNIGDFNLPDTDPQVPTDYVLDGQQRITVIYSCLGAPLNEPGFAAGYDLREQEFLQIKNPHQSRMFPLPHILPLRVLFDTAEYVSFWQSLQSLSDATVLQNRLTKLLDTFLKYDIPIVTLINLNIDEVCPIFERINSSGTQLSTYDLMVATTWSTTFDLDDELKKTAHLLKPKGFGDIRGDTFVKCLSAVNTSNVNRGEILKLKDLKDQLIALVEKTRGALLRAVDLLTTEFKIHSSAVLPYEAQLVILSAIYSKTKTLNAEQRKRIRQWFWRSSFTERYRGAADSYISNDIQMVSEYVIETKHIPETFGEVPSALALRGLEFEQRSSRSRAFILALATKNPRNITNGALIDTSVALSNFNAKQFHHIYPRAYLKRIMNNEEDNLLANVCMLAASENNKIRDKNPNIYLPDCISSLGSEASSVFASNLLPDPTNIDYTTIDYATFLVKRVEILHMMVTHLCEDTVNLS